MELFKGAKAVRLRSHLDKYLVAEEDEEHVSQNRSGASRSARWAVEFVGDSAGVPLLRFKSCYGRYLTASNLPFLLGMTGRKVLHTLPHRLDSSVEWEPIRDGFQVKLKTRYGHFLRANGGPPPWRNSVTHDIPQRTATQDWVLWDVDVIDLQVPQSLPAARPPPPAAAYSPNSSSSDSSPRLSKQESSLSNHSSPRNSSGRMIYYSIANDYTDEEESCFAFKGASVAELTEKLEEETELAGIIVCARNPLNGNLFPLRLQLPPNNTTMHVVVVQATSKVGSSFKRPENPR